MASSSGGRSSQGITKSTGSRFDIFNNFPDNFPENTPNKIKRRRPEVSYATTSFFSKNQKLSDLLDGPKYVVMQRNENNGQRTLSSVSPFLVMKAIEICAGKPKNVKLLRDGSLLILTTTKKQAEKLYKLKSLSDEIQVKVSEHKTLNLSKGTIYCRDIIVSTDDEIKEALKEQNVVDIYRMKRRVDKILVDSGMFILTFNLSHLPTKIDCGYQQLEVREYIPNPRRCFNCQRYGHGAKHCKQRQGTCGKCAEPQHLPAECIQPTTCPNCRNDHPAWDRACPMFQQELNIQRIQTTKRISNFEARNEYSKSKSPPVFTFSDAISSNQPSSSHTHPNLNTINSEPIPQKPVKKITPRKKTQEPINHSSLVTAEIHSQSKTNSDSETNELAINTNTDQSHTYNTYNTRQITTDQTKQSSSSAVSNDYTLKQLLIAQQAISILPPIPNISQPNEIEQIEIDSS